MDKTILVIDDEQDVHEVVSLALSDQDNLHVLAALNGYDGLQMCAEYRPDMILLDLMMPEMNGFDVLDELKANPNFRNTPVIIITAQYSAREVKSRTDTPMLTKANLARDVIELVSTRLTPNSGPDNWTEIVLDVTEIEIDDHETSIFVKYREERGETETKTFIRAQIFTHLRLTDYILQIDIGGRILEAEPTDWQVEIPYTVKYISQQVFVRLVSKNQIQ